MAKKRQSLIGKGADVFFSTPEEPQKPVQAARTTAAKEATVMTTVYLPQSIADQLDEIWLERRKKDKRLQKSHVVTEALRAYFTSLSQ